MKQQEIEGILKDATFVDLSHALYEGMPGWPTHAHYFLNAWEKKADGHMANHNMLVMGEHNGTHVDASLHFVALEDGGHSIESYPPERFCGPCVTLQFDDIAADALVQPEDILRFEQQYGAIRKGDIVLFSFGWATYFTSKTEQHRYTESWPGLSKGAAELLAAREIKMVGCDTFSVDASCTPDCVCHHVFLPKDILIAECLNNLSLLPPRAYFIGMPLRLTGGSGSPIRATAIVANG